VNVLECVSATFSGMHGVARTRDILDGSLNMAPSYFVRRCRHCSTTRPLQHNGADPSQDVERRHEAVLVAVSQEQTAAAQANVDKAMGKISTIANEVRSLLKRMDVSGCAKARVVV
jgi:hypothetical protein